jgi:hypothetical protein
MNKRAHCINNSKQRKCLKANFDEEQIAIEEVEHQACSLFYTIALVGDPCVV